MGKGLLTFFFVSFIISSSLSLLSVISLFNFEMNSSVPCLTLVYDGRDVSQVICIILTGINSCTGGVCNFEKNQHFAYLSF